MNRYILSNKSESILSTCCPPLILLGHEIIKHIDIKVISGHRGREEQNTAFAKKMSTVQYPFSKHNKMPSLAFDIVPYPELYSSTDKFYFLAGVVYMCAKKLEIRIRWGGDWNGNLDLKDQNFFDLAHWEVIT